MLGLCHQNKLMLGLHHQNKGHARFASPKKLMLRLFTKTKLGLNIISRPENFNVLSKTSCKHVKIFMLDTLQYLDFWKNMNLKSCLLVELVSI